LIHFGSIWRTLHSFPWTFFWIWFGFSTGCLHVRPENIMITGFWLFLFIAPPPDPHLHN
jgi:hypothetical protein